KRGCRLPHASDRRLHEPVATNRPDWVATGIDSRTSSQAEENRMSENPIGAAAGAVRRRVFEQVGKHANWWELPLPAQLVALAGFRDDLRHFNLYDTEAPE